MIEVNNICKRYGRRTILNNVSFTINKGDCIGIIGTNGSGKSTLLSILSGTLKADSGEFIINGKNALKHPDIIRRLIGYVPQDNPLINELSVLDNLKLWYCNSAIGLKKELEDGILKYLGLDSILKMQAGKLSGGMKKRLSIGIALAEHPPILILDEPEAALDIVCKRDINRYLNHYLETGGTVIITTHDENEISLCNRVYLMKDQSLTKTEKGLIYDYEQ